MTKKKPTPPEQMAKAYETLMAFPEGVVVLKHILFLSGYNEPLMLVNPHTFEVNQMGSLVNLAKRDMWLEIRQYIKPEHRPRLEQAEVEQKSEPQLEDEKEPDNE